MNLRMLYQYAIAGTGLTMTELNNEVYQTCIHKGGPF